MGATSTKGGSTLPSSSATGNNYRQTNLPPQQPYDGTPVEYIHIVMNATLDIKQHFSFTEPVSYQPSNTDSYFPMLASMYPKGYRMLVFVSLPGQTKSFGFAAMGQTQVTTKFQGIFRKLFPEEMGQQWELKVDKSLLVNKMFLLWSGNLLLNTRSNSGSASDNFHIVQTIDRVSQMGGRLVSVEMTGMAGQEMQVQEQKALCQYVKTGIMPMMQVSVDVFYEIPNHATSERYMYQIVSCPMESPFKRKFNGGQYHSSINWEAVFAQYLGSGWKLVEIFDDQSSSTIYQQTGFSANLKMRKNCLFIFEKPQSRMDDNTPYYEGTMAEHYFKTKAKSHAMGFGGVELNVTTDWELLIDHMGRYGWQVVRILDTPDVIAHGSHRPSLHTRQLIFFQRKIAGRTEPYSLQQGAQPPPGSMPAQVAEAAHTGPEGAFSTYNELYTDKL